MNELFTVLIALLFCLIGYLLGSILFSVIVSKIYKKDVRQFESKNPGATNTWRVLGKTVGFFVAFFDGFKAWLAVLIAWIIFTFTINIWYDIPNNLDAQNLYVLIYLAGAFAVIGHCFPITYVIALFKNKFNFKKCHNKLGGKGVSSCGGVLFAISPWLGLAAFGIWVIVVLTTRYVSVASGLCMFIPAFLIFITQMDYMYFFSMGFYENQWFIPSFENNISLMVGLMAIILFDWLLTAIRHGNNIKNLIKKNERKFF